MSYSATLDWADRDLVSVCYRRRKNTEGTFNREFVKSIGKWKDETGRWNHKYNYTLDSALALEQTVKQWSDSRCQTIGDVTRGNHTICRASMKNVKLVTEQRAEEYSPV